jgi:hypothetical protein
MKTALIALVALALAPAEIVVKYSEDFAETLAKDYGEREGEFLTSRVERDLARALSRAGADVSRVEVTIVDAKPSRPTFKQAGDRPGLDMFRSVSLGGMDLEATAFNAAGEPVGTMAYDWYEWDIRNTGFSTWYDASRASDRFARRFARELN